MIDVLKRPKGVGLHDPLRLAVAVAMAFPDGSMTASGLRREGARGRLVIERIAGKDYTTLFYIERMRDLYRENEGTMPRQSKGARLQLKAARRDMAGRVTHRAT